jgi:hypothetical protein
MERLLPSSLPSTVAGLATSTSRCSIDPTNPSAAMASPGLGIEP